MTILIAIIKLLQTSLFRHQWFCAAKGSPVCRSRKQTQPIPHYLCFGRLKREISCLNPFICRVSWTAPGDGWLAIDAAHTWQGRAAIDEEWRVAV